jgi:hypothetical protein
MALIHEYLSTNLEINIANASHSQIRSGKFFEIIPIFSKLVMQSIIIINLSACCCWPLLVIILFICAPNQRQHLARDAAFLEVKGQGGADRGPAAVLANAVAQSQCRADQRRLPRPGPPKVGQTPVA